MRARMVRMRCIWARIRGCVRRCPSCAANCGACGPLPRFAVARHDSLALPREEEEKVRRQATASEIWRTTLVVSALFCCDDYLLWGLGRARPRRPDNGFWANK
jgi:hypothetical protein